MNTLKAMGNSFTVGPTQKRLSCRGDSNSEAVCFILDRYAGAADLSACRCSVKTKNSAGQSDVDLPEVSADDRQLTAVWTLSSRATVAAGPIQVQLQFEKTDGGGSGERIVWQSSIMEFEIADSLDAADEIADQTPTLFQKWEEKVNTLYSEAREDVQSVQAMQRLIGSQADAVTQTAGQVSQSAADARSAADEAERKVNGFSGYTKAEIDSGFAHALIGKTSGQAAGLDDVQPDTDFRSLLITGSAAQDGTGDPSPDNVRAIRGAGYLETWSGAPADGRNLALKSHAGWSAAGYNVMQGTLSEHWVSGATYTITLKGTVNPGQEMRLWRDRYSVIAAYMAYDAAGGVWKATFQCPQAYPGDTALNNFSIYNCPQSTAVSASIDWIKIERGGAATPWTPAPEDLPSYRKIPLPRPLYSLPDGTADQYDAACGAGTQKLFFLALDGTEPWESSSAAGLNCFSIPLTHTAGASSPDGVTDFLCSHFTPASAGSSKVCLTDFGKSISFYPAIADSLEGWRSYLAAQNAAGTPVSVLYRLASADPYTASAVLPRALSSSVVLSAGGGDLSVQYSRDLAAVLKKIEKKIGGTI